MRKGTKEKSEGRIGEEKGVGGKQGLKIEEM